MTAPRNGGVFAQKALIVIMSVLTAALVSFCGWLAMTVINIDKKITRLNAQVESLLETRSDEKQANKAQTESRVKKLEQDAE